MKPTGAGEPRSGNTRNTTGGRENVPPPTTGGGGKPLPTGRRRRWRRQDSTQCPPFAKGRTGQQSRGPYPRRPPPPEEGKACCWASRGRFKAPWPPKSTKKVFEGGGIVKRNPKGGVVETDKFPHKNILEAEAVLKGRHDNDVWVLGKGVLDPKQWSVHANQPDGARMLSANAMEKLMDCQRPRGKTMTKIRGEA
jgi:hypothetical protein